MDRLGFQWEGTDNPNDPSGVATFKCDGISVSIGLNDFSEASRLSYLMRSAYQLGKNDIIKGFIVATLTVILTGSLTSLQNGVLPDINTIKTLCITGLGAGVAYILKNLLTNSEDQFLKKEPKKDEKAAN